MGGSILRPGALAALAWVLAGCGPYASVRVEEASSAGPTSYSGALTVSYAGDSVPVPLGGASAGSIHCEVWGSYWSYLPSPLPMELKLKCSGLVFGGLGAGSLQTSIPIGDVRDLADGSFVTWTAGTILRLDATSAPTVECRVGPTDARATVTISAARGRSAAGDALVTPDFHRTLRVDVSLLAHPAACNADWWPFPALSIDGSIELEFDATGFGHHRHETTTYD